MKKTKELKQELSDSEKVDYLQQYYHELVSNEVPSIIKEDILKTALGI